MHPEQNPAEIAAKQDAKADTNKLIWIAAGFLGNIIGVLVAYIHQPIPHPSRLFKKSEEYKAFYSYTYKTESQSVQCTLALIGMGILVGLHIIIQFVFFHGLMSSKLKDLTRVLLN